MTTDVVTVSPDMEIPRAADILLKNGVNGVPVVSSEDKIVGILCQSDLISQQKGIPIPSVFTLLDGFFPLSSIKSIERDIQKIAALTVEEAMTTDPVVITPDTPIEEMSALMVDKRFHTLPVVDNGKLVGVVGKEDVLRTLIPSSE